MGEVGAVRGGVGAEQQPRLLSASRVGWGVVYLTVLAGVGLQLARVFGMRVPLPDKAYSILTTVLPTADSVAGLAAVALVYRRETQKTEAPKEQIERQWSVLKETAAYALGFGIIIASLGLQVASVYSEQFSLPHVVNILAGAGALLGIFGLAMEYRRRTAEDKQAEAAGKLADHQWTRQEATAWAFTYLFALTAVGIQVAQAFSHPLPMSDLDVAILTGASALISLFTLHLSHQAELRRFQLHPST